MVKFALALALIVSNFAFGTFAFGKDKIVGIVLDKWEGDPANAEYSKYGKHGFYANKQHYADTIHELCKGVSVVFIPPVMKNLETYAEMIDGLLIPGSGPDIHPKYYNEKVTFETEHDKYRTEFELKFIETFEKQRKPILGICHGMQIINVAFGGTLYQDLPTQTESEINHNPYKDGSVIAHEVIIETQQNVLTDIVGKDNAFMVNSVHHQGVKTLGEGLSSIATSPDGLTEAVQLKSHPFLVGVQWHPEVKLSKTDRRLIETFCSAVKNEKVQVMEATVTEKAPKPSKSEGSRCTNKGPTKECRSE